VLLLLLLPIFFVNAFWWVFSSCASSSSSSSSNFFCQCIFMIFSFCASSSPSNVLSLHFGDFIKHEACCHGCITKANTFFPFLWLLARTSSKHTHHISPRAPSDHLRCCHYKGRPMFSWLATKSWAGRGRAFLLSSYLVVGRITRHNMCSFFRGGCFGKKMTHACGKHPPCHFYQWVWEE